MTSGAYSVNNIGSYQEWRRDGEKDTKSSAADCSSDGKYPSTVTFVIPVPYKLCPGIVRGHAMAL